MVRDHMRKSLIFQRVELEVVISPVKLFMKMQNKSHANSYKNITEDHKPFTRISALSSVRGRGGRGHTILRIKDFDDFIHNFDQKAL